MRTMLDKIWEAHEVAPGLLYVDLHMLHDLGAQAMEGLRIAGRRVRRPDLTLATVDHNVPTTGIASAADVADDDSRVQLLTFEERCRQEGVPVFEVGSPLRGIVHVVGPELGLTRPGSVVVCGDSHTSTHGAFGALAFGIGTSEVEHVLATQCLPQQKPKAFRVQFDGALAAGVTAKDLILHTIGALGTDAWLGGVVEYTGPAVAKLTMEERMTLCNMTIEGGGRAGMIAPDDVTFSYLAGRTGLPPGQALAAAIGEWRELASDAGAAFDRIDHIDASVVEPMVTWGTNPGMVVSVGGRVPSPDDIADAGEREAVGRALAYMGLQAGQRITDIEIDRVFIGSCTNGRLSDLRAAAAVVEGRSVAPSVRAMVSPGSEQVRLAAEAEGLAGIFVAAGFEWRHAGCSMCLAMNGDALEPGERCASTTNRNFEGRQGRGGRTHLVSPAMAAAAAVAGRFVDVREAAR